MHETRSLLAIGLWILVACAAPATLAGCDKKTPERPDVLTMALGADPKSFDPAKLSGVPGGRVAFNIFEGLMIPGPTTEGIEKNAELVRPGVAESYELSDDGKTYTFTLREDAKWSDGRPITSKDFLYSWRRVLEPETAAAYASIFYVIRGARAYNKGETDDWSTVGIRAPDDRTFVVELENPTPYFPEMVSFYAFFPSPKHVIDEHGAQWTRPEHIVSNGAYIVESYAKQKEVVLAKNPEYWNAERVSIPRARLRILDNAKARINAYKTGELHWITSIPPAKISSLVMHPDYRRDPMLGTYFFRVNVSREGDPLADPRVRRALNMATDRVSMVENVLNNLYKPAHSFVYTGLGTYSPVAEIRFDIKAARKLLAEAGYPKGEGFPKLQLLYNTDESHKLVTQALQQQWKRNLGIEVELVNREWKTYLEDVKTLSYDVARAGWIGDYNDPMTFLNMFQSDNSNNNTGWENDEYDRLLAEASREADRDRRLELLQEAERLLLEEGPVIPIYFYTNNFLVDRRIEGFEPHNRDIHLFQYMSMPDDKSDAKKK